MGINTVQKYDPFHTLHETHCGDYDKLLTAGPVHHEDGSVTKESYFFQGVRCEICYNIFTLSQHDLGSPDPFDIENYEGN